MNAMLSRRRTTIVVAAILLIAVVIGVTAWMKQKQKLTPQQIFHAGLEAMERNERPAILDAAESLETFPEYREHVHLLRAAYALRGQSFETTFRELGKLKPEGELREPALLLSAEAFYLVGRLKDAGRLFATVAEEHPGHADAHRWLAAIAYDIGAFDDAMRELDIVILRKPLDFRPHLLKGHMHSDMERYSAAQEAYSRAVELHPPESILADLLPSLARVQVKQRDYAGALETLAKAKPTASNLALQGECDRGMGRQDEARQHVEEALQKEPRDREALGLSGRLYIDAGKPELAVAPLQQVLEQDPHDFETRYQLAQALREMGQAEAADEQMKLSEKTIELRTELAQLTDLAIQKTGDADVRDRMAEVCDALGKHELAATWRKAAANCRGGNMSGNKP